MTIDSGDTLKLMLLMQLSAQVPPFMRERIMHDILRSLGYKLKDDELRQLHEYLNPRPPPGIVACPPGTITIGGGRAVFKPKKKRSSSQNID